MCFPPESPFLIDLLNVFCKVGWGHAIRSGIVYGIQNFRKSNMQPFSHPLCFLIVYLHACLEQIHGRSFIMQDGIQELMMLQARILRHICYILHCFGYDLDSLLCHLDGAHWVFQCLSVRYGSNACAHFSKGGGMNVISQKTHVVLTLFACTWTKPCVQCPYSGIIT